MSPATVYAVAGGKQGLLHTLVDDWTQAPEVDDAYRAIESSNTAEAVLDTVASLTRRMRRDWGDVMRIVLATAPLDSTAGTNLRIATKRYRAGLRAAAVRLADFGALKSDMSVDDATDVVVLLRVCRLLHVDGRQQLVIRTRRALAQGDGRAKPARLIAWFRFNRQ